MKKHNTIERSNWTYGLLQSLRLDDFYAFSEILENHHGLQILRNKEFLGKSTAFDSNLAASIQFCQKKYGMSFLYQLTTDPEISYCLRSDEKIEQKVFKDAVDRFVKHTSLSLDCSVFNECLGRTGFMVHGVMINFTGNYGLRSRKSNTFETFSDYSSSEQAVILETVNLGFKIFSEYQPLLYKILIRTIRIWQICKSDKSGFADSTHLHMPGIIFSRNIHMCSLLEIIEKIYHEALHILFFLYPKLAQSNNELSPFSYHLIRSPWSGNQIRPVNFLHSTLIHFAMIHLYDGISASGRYSQLTNAADQTLKVYVRPFLESEDFWNNLENIATMSRATQEVVGELIKLKNEGYWQRFVS